MANENPSPNPFVRFKQHVDANISAGLGSILGLTAMPATQPRQGSTQTDGWHREQMSHPAVSSSSLQHASTSTRQSSSSLNGTQQQPGTLDDEQSSLPARSDRSGLMPAALDAEEMQDWQHFLLWSAYSPLNAQKWFPMDAVTAFEDLLYAASGQEMPDQFERDAARAFPDESLPLKSVSREVEWFGRLQKAGLLKAWPVRSYRHLTTPEGPNWADIMRKETEKRTLLPGVRNTVTHFDSLSPEEQLAEQRSTTATLMRSSTALSQALKDEFNGKSRPEWKLQALTDAVAQDQAAYAQFLWEKHRSTIKSLPSPRMSVAQDLPSHHVPRGREETQAPDTEEEAYFWLASAVKDSQQSLGKLVDAVTKAGKEFRSSLESSMPESEQADCGCGLPGLAYYPETVREWTDEFGNHRRIQETWIPGPDGVQICMREETMTREVLGKPVVKGTTRTYVAEQRPEAQDGYLRTEIEKRKRENNAGQKTPATGKGWHAAGEPPQKGGGWFW